MVDHFFRAQPRRTAIVLRNIRTLKAIGRINSKLEMNNKFGMLAEMSLQIDALRSISDWLESSPPTTVENSEDPSEDFS